MKTSHLSYQHFFENPFYSLLINSDFHGKWNVFFFYKNEKLLESAKINKVVNYIFNKCSCT